MRTIISDGSFSFVSVLKISDLNILFTVHGPFLRSEPPFRNCIPFSFSSLPKFGKLCNNYRCSFNFLPTSLLPLATGLGFILLSASPVTSLFIHIHIIHHTLGSLTPWSYKTLSICRMRADCLVIVKYQKPNLCSHRSRRTPFFTVYL